MAASQPKTKRAAAPSASSRAVSRARGAGPWLVEAGVVLAVLGVPAAFWFGLRNPFGPPKALVLALGASLVLAGLAVDSTLLAEVFGVVRRSKLAWACAGLIAVAALATATAIDARQGLLGSYPDYRGLLSVLAYGIAGLGGIAIWRRADGPERLGRWVVAGALWVGGIGLAQRVGAFPAGAKGVFGTGWFVSSSAGNSSNLGVVLVLLLPIAVWVALRDRSRVFRAAAWLAAALLALCLVWTLSRGAWVAAVVVAVAGGVALAWLHGRERRAARVWLVAGVAIALIAAAALTPTFVRRARVLVDPAQSTASWRLSTWRSSIAMTAARPLLGYGPNNFHLAYPAFQAPGQVDGRRGYPAVEAAHNLEIDTATSFGVFALALLLAMGGLAAWIVVHRVRAPQATGADADQALALGLALLGGTIALQFHYVTLDTGAILALLLAGLVALEPPAAAPAAAAPASALLTTARGGAAALALAYAAIAVACGALSLADAAEARAASLAQAGAPWPTIRAELTRAESLAGWETQIVRARGTLATEVLVQRADPAAATDGMRAFDAALASTPADPVLAADRASLMLVAGLRARDAQLVEAARSAYVSAYAMDRNTGISLAGEGSATLALGRTQEAIVLLKRAIKLSPRYAPAWASLSRAYAAVGRDVAARGAAARARKWAQ